MKTNYKRWWWGKRLVVAVILPSVLTFCLFTAVFFYIVLPFFQTCLQERKEDSIQMLVDVSMDVCDRYWKMEKRGLLSREEAQRHAIEVLRQTRYGENQKDYFWISDLEAKMVMHPYRPDLEGADVSELKDDNGKSVFVAFAEIAQKEGAGYTDYLWQWKDDPSRIESKISFVKLFKPWSWVIGTGIYIEDVNREISILTSSVKQAVFVILLSISLLLSIVVYVGVKSIKGRESAEAALRSSEEKFRALAENSVDTIMRFDREFRHVYVNPAVQTETGIPAEEFIGKTHAELGFPDNLVEEWEAVIQVVFNTEEVHRTEFKLPSGIWIDWLLVPEFDETNRVKGVVATARDITQIKKAQEENARLEHQLHQSQKMDALGTLAGGIAHDFNNRLAVIRGHAELALEEVINDDEMKEDLESIILAAERSKDLVSQILDFSRRKASAKTSIDAVYAVKESVKMMRASIPSTIAIELHFEDEQVHINANSGQLQQVLINLGVNAAYAMRDEHGHLDISVSTVQLESSATSTTGELTPGEYLCIKMRDDGCGIPNELIERIFEPFFTTKPLTKGTGLGLAVVHGIIRDHNGGIAVESDEGKGTTFTIYLPTTETELKDNKHRISMALGGGESILLVDDEDALLLVCKRMLTSLGYSIQTASDGMSAYELFTRDITAFDLVITDETMPKLTGIRLAEKLNEIAPGTPVILCTGNPDRLDPAALSEIGIKDILIKPYRKKEIGGAIRRVLEKPTQNGIAV